MTLEQLRALGLRDSSVRDRVATGRLHRNHYGTYSVGAPSTTREAQLMAAVLACGPGALLSHRSALELWGICKAEEDSESPVHVLAPNRRGRSPRGIASHRNGSLRSGDSTVLRDIPCTTVPRALLDYAGESSIKKLRSAVAQAEVKKRFRPSLGREQIRRNRGRRGVARFRLVLDSIHPDAKRTRSDLEVAFLDMCERAKIPRPEVNVKLQVQGRKLEVDFLWRDANLIIEADSRQFHDTDSAFLTDRQREQELQVGGWRVSRCTWEQVEHEPRALAQTVRSLLAAAV